MEEKKKFWSRWYGKTIVIFLGAFLLYLLGMSGSVSILLIVLLLYFEFRIRNN